LIKHGKPPHKVFDELLDDYSSFGVDYIVAHNGSTFDRPFLLNKLAKVSLGMGGYEGLERAKWLDTQHDVVYPDNFSSLRLTHLAAEYGFLNPFPHAALFDVFTMLRVLESHDIGDLVKRSLEPWVIIRAVVSYDNREDAKKLRFRWEDTGEKKYPKWWVKKVKVSEVEKERAKANFEIVIVE
jgi:hypothetical protein